MLFRSWLVRRLLEMGIESGQDLELLEKGDLTAPPLPEWTRSVLEDKFPLELNLGDVQYRVEYDFLRKAVTLEKTGGARKTPPSVNTVPYFMGYRVKVRHHTQAWVIRD